MQPSQLSMPSIHGNAKGGVMEYRITAEDLTDEVLEEHFKRKGLKVIGTCGGKSPCDYFVGIEDRFRGWCRLRKEGWNKDELCNKWKEKTK